MDLARAYEGARGLPHWFLAHKQTKGRGRSGRSWLSEDGAFAGTLVLNPDCAPAQAALYSFVIAVSLRETLSHWLPSEGLLHKWPNDVLFSGGKLAGILLEASGNGASVTKLSIGIGINLCTPSTPVQDALHAPTGLDQGTGDIPSKESLLAQLHKDFLTKETIFKSQGFAPIREQWLAHAAKLGEVIRARTTQAELHGTFQGIDGDGNLLLLTRDGQIAIPAADVYF